MTVTDIIETKPNGVMYTATVNGKVYSGITIESCFWAPMQAAIAAGAEVEIAHQS